MLINVEIKDHHSFDLVLVRWYDFCYNDKRRMYKYDCPLLKLTDEYSFVPVESIIELVQIIHRAEYQNEYFANVFMF
jgi:hypothetical protein